MTEPARTLSPEKPGPSATPAPEPRYPGVPAALDGTGAVVAMETAASEAAGAYPITPATNMGEGWALAVAKGERNVFGRRLLFFEPEGEHAAAGVTAGMSMTGLRATNFSASQGIAYMHESLYAAVGKRLTYVLNVACRAITKQSLNIHCAHDDYHAVDDAGFFQVFARDVQAAADLNLISHRIAELALNPGICAQDGFLTSHVIETLRLPERELVAEYLGDPSDRIECPTPAQRLIFGPHRRRVPELFDYDNPAMLGTVQNQDSYAQGVAAQRPFFFDHIAALSDQAMAEYTALTGRPYARAMGYRCEDAEYVIVAQGSLVPNAEAVCDLLREERGIRCGVVNLVMFRPFPADLVVAMLRGKRGVTVLERVDQPLSPDPPLLREIRTAIGQGLENGRASAGSVPYPGVPALQPIEAPLFFSGCGGLGSRDIQPGDLVAAVENMLPDGARKRRFYLGFEFVRPNAVGGLARLQEQLVAAYPGLSELALRGDDSVVIRPEGSLATRIHSIGGWGAITMGKNITKMLFDLLGLHVKSNPKYGSEKKGMPTTFFAAFAHEPIRLNCDLKHVDVVLSPDANVFSHSNPLAGLEKNGVFVIQSAEGPEALWASLPRWAQEAIVEHELQVYCLDAFAIARQEATDPELQFRMQGNAFQGAFFRTSPLMEREGLDEGTLFEAIREQLRKTFGGRGERVVEDNFRVIRRGYEEVQRVVPGALRTDQLAKRPLAWYLKPEASDGGIGDRARFYEQTAAIYRDGADPIADPFLAISAIPAATGVFRDMTAIRFDVPEFLPANCTGCGECWTQCPDVAIPGLVSDIGVVLATAIDKVGAETPIVELRAVVDRLADEVRARLGAADAFDGFAGPLAAAFEGLLPRLEASAERRATLTREFQAVLARVRELPLTKVTPYFDAPEARQAGSGGLLSITINPNTCKGCMLCVDVCGDGALRPIPQTAEVVDRLRSNWDFWESLPDTPDRFVQVRDWERGIGVLASLLLKKDAYHALVGGDGACMGCGEKTVIHLALAAIEGAMMPRVARFVERLDELVDGLEQRARLLITRGTRLDAMPTDGAHVDLALDAETRVELARIKLLAAELRDLKWRYVEGPTGRGRATMGMTNATGCSSVWAGTYPYNPYPYPWTNHLFQDAPSIAIGIFEGHMRKMADAFAAVRRAEMVIAGTWNEAVDEHLATRFDYREFTDDELHLCPPVVAVGGDGAMYDIGFQNLSRLLASGKPLRVFVLDTQVYSNTGGQACTSGFLGQAADMSPYGAAQHGKTEVRKELSFIAMAHRTSFVMQSSQATPAHLMGGVLRGIASRRPALFVLHSPCMPEHGISDDAAHRAAKMALESRAFPHFIYDPDAGATSAERLDLTGNPAPDELWPTYTLRYLDGEDNEQSLELPVTVADWAASETRFRKHFRSAREHSPNQVPFHELVAMPAAERVGKVGFIWALDAKRHLMRVICSREMVALAEDRIDYYRQLRQMAGLDVPQPVRDLVSDELRAELDEKLRALRAEYEARLAELEASYPQLVAGRIAEVLLGAGANADLLSALTAPGLARPAAAPAKATGAAAGGASAGPAAGSGADDALLAEPAYVNKALCTACDECTKLNPKIFAYDENKKAYVKNPAGGPFKDIVLAAERCPASCIHPGEPQNPNERDLAAWVERAAAYN
jgi:pyruvate-ferredoxin/flavodoxin oxidoreductase